MVQMRRFWFCFPSSQRPGIMPDAAAGILIPVNMLKPLQQLAKEKDCWKWCLYCLICIYLYITYRNIYHYIYIPVLEIFGVMCIADRL